MGASLWNPADPAGSAASLVPFEPTVNISAENVQAAIEEVDTEYRAAVATINAFLDLIYARTSTEISLGITPVAYQYPPGHVRRYGAVSDWNGATGTDASVAFQRAADVAAAERREMIVDGGDFYLGSTCLDFTSDNGLQKERFSLRGAGKNATRLFWVGASTLIECQGSDAISIRDISFYGNSSTKVVLFQGRQSSRQWGGNLYIENAILYAPTNPTANNNVGSIALLNCEGEESRYHNVEFWADVPVMIAPPNACSIATFDATCNYTSERTFTYTPIYKSIVATAISNTVFTFSGQCRMVAWTRNSPCVALRSVSDVDFGNSFLQMRGSGTNNPFIFDCNNVFRMFSTGTHEPASSAPMGAMCTRGTLDGAIVKTTTGWKSGATNNVPILYVTNLVGAKMSGSDLDFRINEDQDQLPIKVSTTSTWGVELHDTDISFHGTALLSTLPANFLFNATKTKITFGPKTGGGEDYGSVWADTRYRRVYPISKVLPAAANTDILVLNLPPTDLIGAVVRFRGTLIAGYIVGQPQAYTMAGEFVTQLTRRAATTNLTASTSSSTWDAGQSTDAASLGMSAPTISYVLTGQTKVTIQMLANTSGGAAASVSTLLSGEIEVISGYGNGAQGIHVELP